MLIYLVPVKCEVYYVFSVGKKPLHHRSGLRSCKVKYMVICVENGYDFTNLYLVLRCRDLLVGDSIRSVG